jgi:hypothetical protein
MKPKIKGHSLDKNMETYQLDDWLFLDEDKIKELLVIIPEKMKEVNKRFLGNLKITQEGFDALPSRIKPPKSVFFKMHHTREILKNLFDNFEEEEFAGGKNLNLEPKMFFEKINIDDISRYIRFHSGDVNFNLLKKDCELLNFGFELLEKQKRQPIRAMKVKKDLWQAFKI